MDFFSPFEARQLKHWHCTNHAWGPGIQRNKSRAQPQPSEIKNKFKKLNCPNCRRYIYKVIGTAESKGRQLVILTVHPLLSPTSIPALIKTHKAIPIAMWTWKGGENSTTIVACPFHNLPVRQEGNLWNKREAGRKQSRSLSWTSWQVHSQLAAAGWWEHPMSAWSAPEGWQQPWKPKTLVGNFCTPAALCASSIKSRHPEDYLPGWSCAMAKASVPTLTLNPGALGHHPSPGRATALGNISPVVLQFIPCWYSNKPGCNGWNKLSCLCLWEGGKRYELQAGRSPSNLISFSKSCSLFGHNFTTIFISTPFIFLIYFFPPCWLHEMKPPCLSHSFSL